MADDVFWTNIFKRQKVVEENIFSVLKRVPIFQDLTYKELKAIERILHRRTYKTDEIIFKEYLCTNHIYYFPNYKMYQHTFS